MTLTAIMIQSGPAVVICISLSLGCGGFAWAGFSINHLDIAPQVKSYKLKHTHFFSLSFLLGIFSQ
jgi:ACS family sodium-dependent inorganic phosphate cotransporter